MNENTNPDVKTIENATGDDVRPGDHITWEQTEVRKGVTRTVRREGIAHHRDSFGAWWTEDHGLITNGEGIALTLRRPVQDLPTEPGTVLDPADGHE